MIGLDRRGVIGAIEGMSPARPKILIIEDDAKMSNALVSGIGAAGYEVLTAGTAEEGFFWSTASIPIFCCSI